VLLEGGPELLLEREQRVSVEFADGVGLGGGGEVFV
jgi:hypothetical protein